MDTRIKRLKEAFYKSGLTQTEVCARSGITKGALSSYLSGRYMPKQKALEKLADVLHVSINYLMGIDDTTPQIQSLPPSTIRKTVKIMSRLNDRGQNKVADYADDLDKSGLYTRVNETEPNGGVL